jgi:hypothetical protein
MEIAGATSKATLSRGDTPGTTELRFPGGSGAKPGAVGKKSPTAAFAMIELSTVERGGGLMNSLTPCGSIAPAIAGIGREGTSS